MTVVVDASVGVALSLAAPGFGGVEREMTAPVLFRSEVLSALAGLEWRREISKTLADRAVAELLEAPVVLVRKRKLWEEARLLARRLGWAKTYDAEYVSLARLERLPLLTLDSRLARRVGELVEVVLPTDL